ncbi:MAG TPA: SDR family NAD(P)-dependent oxidoreductase [Propionicimonas sp.]|nr:SDR family NAD(P)-dependent oxidoreductase [Propionicimonas sp.]
MNANAYELREVTAYVLEQVRRGVFDADSSVHLLERLNGAEETPTDDDEIAIIGMSCKFPHSDDYDEYWDNLVNQVGVIGSFPKERRDDMGEEVKLQAGWLEHIGDFDASFFRISPAEAMAMHPEQRIFLEQAWACLEDAGYCGQGIRGSNTGVFVGVDHSYPMDYKPHDAEHNLLDMAGSMSSVLASRIAYVLDLKGPNMVVDTACSSGLVAIHQACTAMRAGDCDMAIAGGLHLLSVVDATFDGVASEDGVLCSFDRRSSGTVWGEGFGFVTLKPARKAIADGDYIYAIIKGIAINNDGHTTGVTAPSADTQADVVEDAWRQANIDPEHLSYVEAHATGTILGDPIEVTGLRTAFDKHTSRRQFCALGSVKPNLGHGVSAASMASLIKVLLAFRERQLPPNINFTEPNPYIPFHESPLYVSDTTRDWEPNGPVRLAAVSSFGFGRTNVHAVLSEAPPREVARPKRRGPLILPLSGRTEAACLAQVDNLIEWIDRHPEAPIEDICHSAAVGRHHFEYRVAVVGTEKGAILRGLRDIASRRWDAAGVFRGHHRVLSANMERLDDHDLSVSDRRRMARVAADLVSEGIGGAEQAGELCHQYVAGADVQWPDCFPDGQHRRLPLPTYPFERKHFWLAVEDSKPTVAEAESPLHPLIDRLAVRGRDEDVYVTKYEIGRQWILTEHIINDHSVIPGTGFLEMMYTACAHSSGSVAIELRDVFLQSPAIVAEEEPLEVHIVVGKTAETMNVEVMSVDVAGQWKVHATAQAKVLDPESRPASVNHEAVVRASCRETLPFDLSKEYGGFRFGPRWRNVNTIEFNGQQVLTSLEIAPQFQADLAEFTLHPAMFDNAINIAGEFLIQFATHTMFLPFACKSLKIYGALPSKFNSHQRIRTKIGRQMGAATIDITLYEPDGTVLCVLDKYSLKRVSENLFTDTLHHRMAFERQPALPLESRLGTIVFFGNDSASCQRLVDGLRQHADRVVNVRPGPAFEQIGTDEYCAPATDPASLLQHLPDAEHIVHAGSLSLREAQSPDELQQQQTAALLGMVTLIQTLGDEGRRARICVLTSDVHRVLESDDPANPMGAAALALARVANNESVRLTMTGIDADNSFTPEHLAAELAHGAGDPVVAIRRGERYLPELQEASIETFEAEAVSLRADGVYVVTGGLDGIAGVLIDALTTSDCKPHFAVISRTPEGAGVDDPKTASRAQRLAELQEKGANIELLCADITELESMETAMVGLRERHGRINGLIHGAGVPGGCLLRNRTTEDFERVLRPKIMGSWTLRRVTADDDLDFSVFNSSLISIFGPLGQGDYAAANAYLNGLADADRARGRKSTSIAWSIWAQTGMSRKSDIDSVRGVFQSLSDSEGHDSFLSVLDRRIGTVLVGALDRQRVIDAGGQIGVSLAASLSAKLVHRRSPQTPKPLVTVHRDVTVTGRGAFTETQIALANIWGGIQGMDEVNVRDPFSETGGDSIVLSQFVSAINERFGRVIDISDVYSRPTVHQLADYVDRQLGADQASGDPEALTVEEIMDRVESGTLTLDEASRLLDHSEVRP